MERAIEQNNFSVTIPKKNKRQRVAKNPMGFSVAIAVEYLFFTSLLVMVDCFFLIAIATLPLLFSLTDDIKWDLKTIQQSLKLKAKRLKMAKPLAQFIQFHSNTRQFSLKIIFNRILHDSLSTKIYVFLSLHSD